MSENKIIEGKVLQVIDEYSVAINKGERDGVYSGQIFLIYHLSTNDMIDEDTGENLGKIEYVIGKGKVTHLQEKIATIKSIETSTSSRKTVRKSNNVFGIPTQETITEPDEVLLAFNDCKIGYLAKSMN